MSTQHTPGPLVVRMAGTCSGAWAVIGQECVDPATGEEWFRELGQTETTHVERRTRRGQPIAGMPGDIVEKPQRFTLTADGQELLANARLWAVAPELLRALQMCTERLFARMHTDSGDDYAAYSAACAVMSAAGKRCTPGAIAKATGVA